MKCLACNGSLENKRTTFMTEIDNTIVIIKSVPSHVCSQCGEVSYPTPVVQELSRIVDSLRATLTEIAIVNYPEQVA